MRPKALVGPGPAHTPQVPYIAGFKKPTSKGVGRGGEGRGGDLLDQCQIASDAPVMGVHEVKELFFQIWASSILGLIA